MNRLIVAAVAVSALVAPPLAQAQERPPEGSEVRAEDRRDAPHRDASHHQAQPQQRQRPQAMPPQYRAEVRQPHAWRTGERFERSHAPHYTRVVYVDHYGLKPPPRGYVWVRSGWDALLVRLTNNIIVAIQPGVFR